MAYSQYNRRRFEGEKPVNEGETYDIVIDATGAKGDGIGKVKGFVVIVPNAKPGQTVKVKIDAVRGKVAFGTLVGEAEATPAGEAAEEETPKGEQAEEPAEEEAAGQEEPAEEEKAGQEEPAEEEPAEEEKADQEEPAEEEPAEEEKADQEEPAERKNLLRKKTLKKSLKKTKRRNNSIFFGAVSPIFHFFKLFSKTNILKFIISLNIDEVGILSLITTTERRVGNFAEKKTWRCLYCGKDIENPTDLYSRRFCTVSCKDAYFSPF